MHVRVTLHAGQINIDWIAAFLLNGREYSALHLAASAPGPDIEGGGGVITKGVVPGTGRGGVGANGGGGGKGGVDVGGSAGVEGGAASTSGALDDVAGGGTASCAKEGAAAPIVATNTGSVITPKVRM